MIVGAKRAKDTAGKHTELTWAHGDSERLNCQPENLRRANLGPLQVLHLYGLVFLWHSWQREWGLPLTLLPALGTLSSCSVVLSSLVKLVSFRHT